MRPMDLETLLKATGGVTIATHHQYFDGIGSDTRASLKNQIFIALKGDAFDAHDFVAAALEQGATALLIHNLTPEIQALKDRVTIVQVKDTLKALQDLATYFRELSPAKVVAITGSNGKTTSKEFTADILQPYRRVHYSKGSFNNHWGVPVTLLAEPEGTEISVVEMGMNHAGEIRRLVEIAKPDVVVCTTVGRAHIEHFGSVDAIAAAKAEVYEAKNAVGIFNLDNPYTQKMSEQFAKTKLTFSAKVISADVHLKIQSMTMRALTLEGAIAGVKGQVDVPVFGAHNLTNLMVAAANALACGISPDEIWQGLQYCKTTWGRNQYIETQSRAEILFDAYNANPDSMTALLENVRWIKNSGKKIGVFGEMLELGELAPKLHREVGELAGKAGLDSICFFGAHAADFEAGVKASGFSKKLITSDTYKDSLANEIALMLKDNDIVLVKGSRGMKLERFVLAASPLNFSLKKE